MPRLVYSQGEVCNLYRLFCHLELQQSRFLMLYRYAPRLQATRWAHCCNVHMLR